MENEAVWNNAKKIFFFMCKNKVEMQNSRGKALMYLKITLFMYFVTHIFKQRAKQN